MLSVPAAAVVERCAPRPPLPRRPPSAPPPRARTAYLRPQSRPRPRPRSPPTPLPRRARRDLRVWRFAVEAAHAPILQLLSGGYTRASAGVIVDALAAALTRYALPAGRAGGGGSVGAGSGGGGGAVKASSGGGGRG
jgi:uncharacterized membrane protein YgcG